MIKDGIININKPQDWTSHDVVKILRRVTGQKRTGHTGTLDPMATGVLPVCFGPATRIMDYLDLDFKKYECTLQLGIMTDTLDVWGEVTEEKSYSHVNEDMIEEVIEKFKGHLSQIPPKYSAIKVQGRKLYDYARSGEEVEVKAREIYIKEIECDGIDLENGRISFSCECSKGTYIRSICRDIGYELGTVAAMSALTRTATGIFEIKDSVDIETLREASPEEVEDLLYPVDYPLVHFGQATVNAAGAKWFSNGGWLEPRRVRIIKRPEYEEKEAEIDIKEIYKMMYNIYELRDGEKIFLGTAGYNKEENMYIPDKIFKR